MFLHNHSIFLPHAVNSTYYVAWASHLVWFLNYFWSWKIKELDLSFFLKYCFVIHDEDACILPFQIGVFFFFQVPYYFVSDDRKQSMWWKHCRRSSTSLPAGKLCNFNPGMNFLFFSQLGDLGPGIIFLVGAQSIDLEHSPCWHSSLFNI